jgi:hypothetical protein
MEQAEANGIWESVGWWYKSIAEFCLQCEAPHMTEEEKEQRFPGFKKMQEGVNVIPMQQFHDADMVVVGDPDRCFEKMKHYADLCVDQLICYVQFGYHSGESPLRTIELLGWEALPELERYVASGQKS